MQSLLSPSIRMLYDGASPTWSWTTRIVPAIPFLRILCPLNFVDFSRLLVSGWSRCMPQSYALAKPTYTFMHDLPLPKILCPRHVQSTGSSHSARHSIRVVEEDIVQALPEVIAISHKTFVTMLFMEWIDRRRRLLTSVAALGHDVLSLHMDGVIAASRERAVAIIKPYALLTLQPSLMFG